MGKRRRQAPGGGGGGAAAQVAVAAAHLAPPQARLARAALRAHVDLGAGGTLVAQAGRAAVAFAALGLARPLIGAGARRAEVEAGDPKSIRQPVDGVAGGRDDEAGVAGRRGGERR